ncbi:DUF6207 family protein [Streptomyces lydicus]|uniref:DUF6207 family protein n=1 Tax=Streptomyces lydicus TaxID=47763 RepID=UPI0037A6522E
MTQQLHGTDHTADLISEEHLREPGLVVIDITAADETTATQAATPVGGLWLSSGPSPPGTPPAGPASPSVPTPTCTAYRHMLNTPAPTVRQGRAATTSTPAPRS